MINRIRALRREGYSYSEISKKVYKSKKFVWRKSNGVQFSKKGEKRYQRLVSGIIKEIKAQELSLSVNKVRIIGHVLFDGCSYKNGYSHIIRYINSSKRLVDQFIEDIEKVYGIFPTHLEVIKNPKVVIYKVTFSSKLLFEDLKRYFSSYSTKDVSPIPKEIMDSSKEIKLEFLRAFWEDEGSISFNGRLMADQKNEVIIRQLIEIHKDFGLNLKLCSYKDYTGMMYKIYLSKNKDNLVRFYNLNLFDKSTVTRGKNLGKDKKEVLKKIIEDSTIASRLDGH